MSETPTYTPSTPEERAEKITALANRIQALKARTATLRAQIVAGLKAEQKAKT